MEKKIIQMQHIKTILTIILVSQTLLVISQTWPKYYGETDKYDFSEDIIETYDKGYIMCGNINDYSSGTIKNGWLIKTDVNGEILWEKIFENDINPHCRFFPIKEKISVNNSLTY